MSQVKRCQLGRSAKTEARSAALSSDFGMQMLRAKFPDMVDEILAELGVYSRGPRKGLPRGYVHWTKIVEGGFDRRPKGTRKVLRGGTIEWCVLRSDDPMGFERFDDNITGIIYHRRGQAQRAAADQAAKERAERRAGMSKFDVYIEKAMEIRTKAHKFLCEGNTDRFNDSIITAQYFIGRARKVRGEEQ